MKRVLKYITISFLSLLLTFINVLTVSAHTPIGSGDNESLANATVIPNSAKSWAVYTDLHTSGEAQYYRFEASKGEIIPIQLYTSPSRQDEGFTPSFVLMGPGIKDQGSIPGYVEQPISVGYMVVRGTPPTQATYEAFSPSVFLQVADISFKSPADGTYYIAVYDDERGGRYGVAIGAAESFTPYEWITTPLSFSSIYVWEGQSLFLVYSPAFLILVLGIGLLNRRQRRGQRLDLVGWLAAIAGLLFLGSGATVASQMAVSLLRSTPDALMVATVLLAIFPILIGVLTIRYAMHRSGNWTLGSRVILALLGIVSLLVWAGYLIGPAIAIASAVIPTKIGSTTSDETRVSQDNSPVFEP